jgi:hypothetical protein
LRRCRLATPDHLESARVAVRVRRDRSLSRSCIVAPILAKDSVARLSYCRNLVQFPVARLTQNFETHRFSHTTRNDCSGGWQNGRSQLLPLTTIGLPNQNRNLKPNCSSRALVAVA